MAMDPNGHGSNEVDDTVSDGDRMKFDEGRVVADRLDELDAGETESFDDVFAEFDSQFSDE